MHERCTIITLDVRVECTVNQYNMCHTLKLCNISLIVWLFFSSFSQTWGATQSNNLKWIVHSRKPKWLTFADRLLYMCREATHVKSPINDICMGKFSFEIVTPALSDTLECLVCTDPYNTPTAVLQHDANTAIYKWLIMPVRYLSSETSPLWS